MSKHSLRLAIALFLWHFSSARKQGENNLSSLVIFESSKCIGRIYADELKCFINRDDQEDQLIYHRLNFDLQTAIAVMRRDR